MTDDPITDDPITDDPITDDYDIVTSRDITELLHCLAHLHWGVHSGDPAERTAFLHRKAELFTRIADQHARRDPTYSAEVRQLAANARTAAENTDLRLPKQRTGPNQRRTPGRQPDTGGSRSQENSGANSG